MKVVCLDFDDVLTDKDALTKFVEVFGHAFRELEYGVELLEDNKSPKKFFLTIKKVIMLGRGVRYEHVEQIADCLKPCKNAKAVMRILKKKGYVVVIVSTNDQNIIKRFLKKYGMAKYVDHIYASRLLVKNGLLTGGITGEVIKTEKTGVVKQIMRLYDAKKDEIFFVGDGMTDLPIIKKLGRGILLCPNPVVNAEILADRDLMKMQKAGNLFLVEKKDLAGVLDYID